MNEVNRMNVIIAYAPTVKYFRKSNKNWCQE